MIDFILKIIYHSQGEERMKITNYLKRYYKAIYDYTLYKEFFKEKIFFAFLMVLPMYFVFTYLTYNASLVGPTFIKENFPVYEEMISHVKESDILEDGSDKKIELAFKDGKLILNQDKLYDKVELHNDWNYRLIIDTKNEMNVEYKQTNRYSDEIRTLLGFNSNRMVVYSAKDFIIVSSPDSILSYKYADIRSNASSIEEIRKELDAHFINKKLILQFSFVVNVILYFMFFIVVYIIIRTLCKRYNLKIAADRKIKILFYAMVPGLYVYLLITIFFSSSSFIMSYIAPILSMLAMTFTADKIILNVKTLIKLEDKIAKKSKKKNNSNNDLQKK